MVAFARPRIEAALRDVILEGGRGWARIGELAFLAPRICEFWSSGVTYVSESIVSTSTQFKHRGALLLPLHRHHQIRERPQRRIHFRLRQVLAPHHLEQRVLAVEAGR